MVSSVRNTDGMLHKIRNNFNITINQTERSSKIFIIKSILKKEILSRYSIQIKMVSRLLYDVGLSFGFVQTLCMFIALKEKINIYL